MSWRRGVAGVTASVASLGLALPATAASAAPQVAPEVPQGIPIGLLARGGAAVKSEDPAPQSSTYPVNLDFTNDTPYTLHIWPEWWNEQCWNEPGNPKVTLKPGETGGGTAWTKTSNLHCTLAYRVSIVGPGGEYYLQPPQSFYPGPGDNIKPTFTFYFPDSPEEGAWMWTPWGYWALPDSAMGVNMRDKSALFFRVSKNKSSSGPWDNCNANNSSSIYCHLTISTSPGGMVRPHEYFERGVKPDSPAKLVADPTSWPTIAAIQTDGCLVRGIKEDRCAKVDGKVDFANLTAQEKNFTLDPKNIKIVGEMADSGSWVNQTPVPAEYKFTRTVTVGEDSSSTSTDSRSIGGSVKFGVKTSVDMKVFAFETNFSVSVNANHQWETSQTQTNSHSESKTNEYTITIPKMSKVDWRILQNTITTTDSQYSADVVLGPDSDQVEPITSTMFSWSLISPVDSQPCLALAIGNTSIPFSMLALRKWTQDNGGVGDASRTRRFLNNTANFSSSGHCPGMPSGYPSRAQFKGSGFVRDTQKGKSAACTYFAPLKQGAKFADRPRGGVQQTPEAPKAEENTIYNFTPKCDGPKLGSAVSFDATVAPFKSMDTIKGTKYGDLMMAKGRSDVALLGGDSRDLIEGGSGAGNVLDGQSGDDVIQGGPAAEMLLGGPGSDNLRGGAGADELIDDAGKGNFMAGQAGNDLLVAAKGETTLSGGPGKDVLEARSGVIGMIGGAGKDTYLVRKNAKDLSVTELPGRGTDVVKAWRSFTMAQNVEVLRLQGDGNIKGTGTYGHQLIVGNSGNNVLKGGGGFDTLRGKKGSDTIHLASVGFDKATGGAGKDRFVLNGEPTAVAETATGKPALAHKVTDFKPGEDKLVLSAKVHGPEVTQLAKVFKVFDPSAKRPGEPRGAGPALVVNTKTGVVRYDRDEAGRSPERVLVQLPKGTKLTAKEIEIR